MSLNLLTLTEAELAALSPSALASLVDDEYIQAHDSLAQTALGDDWKEVLDQAADLAIQYTEIMIVLTDTHDVYWTCIMDAYVSHIVNGDYQ